MAHPPLDNFRRRWQRRLWLLAGGLSLLIGLIGIVLPLVPTAPLVLLAAYCFSRGSARWEAWILAHPAFGPMVLDWRQHRAVPLRAKQIATVMMAISSVATWWFLQSPWRWIPGLCCLAVALWLWCLPTAAPRPSRVEIRP
jgi:uncharacterized membrane protein YbaN (DUF454 family)